MLGVQPNASTGQRLRQPRLGRGRDRGRLWLQSGGRIKSGSSGPTCRMPRTAMRRPRDA